MSIILVSHDLRVVRQIADRAAVMKDGEIVEIESVDRIFENQSMHTQRSFWKHQTQSTQ